MSIFLEKFQSLSLITRIALCLLAWIAIYPIIHFALALLRVDVYFNFVLYAIISYWCAIPFILWFIVPLLIYKFVHAATKAFFDAKK